MPDDDKPSPLLDAVKGFGLLFRAAKNAAAKIPTEKIEKAVVHGAKEMGRAVENVGNAIERQFKKDPPNDDASPDAQRKPDTPQNKGDKDKPAS